MINYKSLGQKRNPEAHRDDGWVDRQMDGQGVADQTDEQI